jgi:S1-C subfamily serine protease
MKRFASCFLVIWLAAPIHASRAAEEVDIRRDATVIAIEKVLPTVVNIATEAPVEYHDFYDALLHQFYGQSPRATSLGSGVIVDEDGYVLTNFHVVRRATRIQVKLWDGREYDADPVVQVPTSDVALIKLRIQPGERFKAIKLAADDDLLLGETVLALGNPYGLGGSVTKGILSSKNRRPSSGNEPLNVEDWLQTDATINPGNSGGPLVNLRAELIGLNVAVYRGEQGMGMGFSIPVKQISAALSRYITPETTDSLWFGALVGLGPGPLTVREVQPGSPAALGGLAPGDKILQVNATPVTNLIAFNQLLTDVSNREPRLLVQRVSERRTMTVRLVGFEDLIRQKLGLTLLEPTPQTEGRLGLRTGQGLYVEDVEKDSPAARAEFKRGYFISEVDGAKVTEVRQIGEIVSQKKAGQKVRVGVIVPRRIGPGYKEFRSAAVEVPVR